jgi:hypothetical protein
MALIKKLQLLFFSPAIQTGSRFGKLTKRRLFKLLGEILGQTIFFPGTSRAQLFHLEYIHLENPQKQTSHTHNKRR